ncbi:MAG: methyl-accepting chemotaxis protein [Aestuariibacter sp.]
MRLINNLSVKSKLLVVAGVPLLLMLISVILANISIRIIGEELASIANKDIPMTNSLNLIIEHQLKQEVEFEKIMHYGVLSSSEPTYRSKLQKATQAFDKLNDDIENDLNNASQLSNYALKNASIDEEKNEFEKIAKGLRIVKQQHDGYVQEVRKIVAHIERNEIGVAEELVVNVEATMTSLNDTVTGLTHDIGQFTANAADIALQHEKQTERFLLFLLLIATVLSIAVGWVVSKNMLQRLYYCRNALQVLANKDLSQNVVLDGKDELSELVVSIGQLGRELREIVAQLIKRSENLNTHSKSLNAITELTHQNINTQKIEIEQVASAITQMNAAIQEITKRITETADSCQTASNESASTRDKVKHMLESVQVLSDDITVAQQSINALREDTDNITSVLDVIKGVADQTNLLALNAAIEAARAGEQGRGFAVVADEVRTLASKTQSSTTEINQTIDKLQQGAARSVEMMQGSTDKSKIMVENAHTAEMSLTTVADSVDGISAMSFQIATATNQQSTVIEEINKNVVRINDSSNNIVGSSKELAHAAGELTEISKELVDITQEFKL